MHGTRAGAIRGIGAGTMRGIRARCPASAGARRRTRAGAANGAAADRRSAPTRIGDRPRPVSSSAAPARFDGSAQEGLEKASARSVTQTPESALFDLTNPLARDPEERADLL